MAREIRGIGPGVKGASWFRTYETGGFLRLVVWRGARRGMSAKGPDADRAAPLRRRGAAALDGSAGPRDPGPRPCRVQRRGGIHVSDEDVTAAVVGEAPVGADRRYLAGRRRLPARPWAVSSSAAGSRLSRSRRRRFWPPTSRSAGRIRRRVRAGAAPAGSASGTAGPAMRCARACVERDRLEPLVRELLDYVNHGEVESVLPRAAMAHPNLALLHPFTDGNGRTARCVQTAAPASDGIAAPAYRDVLAEVGGGAWRPERDAKPWARFPPDRPPPPGAGAPSPDAGHGEDPCGAFGPRGGPWAPRPRDRGAASGRRRRQGCGTCPTRGERGHIQEPRQPGPEGACGRQPSRPGGREARAAPTSRPRPWLTRAGGCVFPRAATIRSESTGRPGAGPPPGGPRRVPPPPLPTLQIGFPLPGRP